MLFAIGACTFKRPNVARACDDVACHGHYHRPAGADGTKVLKAGEKLLCFSFNERQVLSDIPGRVRLDGRTIPGPFIDNDDGRRCRVRLCVRRIHASAPAGSIF